MDATLKEILFDFFKLKQSLLLVWTGFFSYLAATHLNPNLYYFALTLLAMFLTIAGTTGFNMVLDADLDYLMFRTHKRPIPSGKLSKLEGTILSLGVVAIGLTVSLLVNFWVFLAGLLGFITDIMLYTYLLKRKSPWSTIVGGFAGGMPALGGWAGAMGNIDLPGVLLLLLVAIWSNVHIWTLATFYVEDYRRANVPMLPVARGERAGVIGSLVASLIIVFIVMGLFVIGLLGTIGLLISLTPLLIAVLYLLKGLQTKDYKDWSYKAFKMVNMFMAIVFLSLILK